MADTVWNVVEFETPAITGTFDITATGVGTPTAAIFFIASAAATDTDNSNFLQGFGFTDGTNSKAVGARSQNASGTSNTSRAYGSNACIRIPNNAGSASISVCSFDSWISNGVRLNQTTTTGNTLRGFCIFLSGGIANIDIRSQSLGTAVTQQTVTLGFEPHFLMGIGIGSPTDGVVGTNNHLTFGMACNNYLGAVSQKSFVHHDVDGFGTTDSNQRIRYGSFAGQLAQAAVLYNVTIDSLDATGYKFTSSANAGSDYLAVLAIEFDDKPDMEMVDFDIPAAGNLAVTLNITPGFHVAVGTWSLASSGSGANQTGISETVTAFSSDDTDVIGSMQKSDDNAATSYTRCQRTSEFQLYHGNAATTTKEFDSSGRTNQANGYTFVATNNPASARLGWGFSVAPAGVSNFFVGSSAVDGMKIGSTDVDAAYLGSTQIF